MKNLIIISLLLFGFAINQASSQSTKTRIFRGGAQGLDFELMLDFTKTSGNKQEIKGHYFFHKSRKPMAVTGSLVNGILKIKREDKGRVREIFTAKQNGHGRWIGTVKIMNKNLTKNFFVDELRGKASRGRHGSAHWAWNLETNDIIYPENVSGYSDQEVSIQTLLNHTDIYDKLSEGSQYDGKPLRVNGKLFTGKLTGYGNYGENLVIAAKFEQGNLVGKVINFNKKWEEENGGSTQMEEEDVAIED